MNSYTGQLGDKRLENRALLIEEGFARHQTAIIHQAFPSWKDQQACYRFMNNSKISEDDLIRSVTSSLKDKVIGKQVLVLQDTSEYHYHHHRNKIPHNSGLGDTGRHQLGYFSHPSLALDASNGDILGLSSIHLWHRPIVFNDPTYDSSKRKQHEIEEKESYKWIKGIQSSESVLQKAKHRIYIQDREGDIYETFCEIYEINRNKEVKGLGRHSDLLVRSRTDRNIEGGKLYTLLEQQDACVEYEFEVKPKPSRTARQAIMEVRYTEANIQRPASLNKHKQSYPPFVKVTIVEAREKQSSVPLGEEPVIWRIITTCKVSDWLDAVTIVYWYTLRWLIEEYFGLHKSKGLNIEQAELATGYGLRKLGIMTMQATVKVMQLKQARDEQESQMPIEVTFDEKEQECLNELLPQLEGSTTKLKNPHSKHLLVWATWIIARLGGWKGYESQRPPGLTTLSKGLERFERIYQGWALAKGFNLN